MHSIACFWVKIGTENENTWVDERELDKGDSVMLYITALYWVTATLTTVGYGDVKSQIRYEYMYTMFTEFVGIGFFSFIMGSINTVLLADVGGSDEIAEKIEQVDIWLVALDNAKKEKSLPNVLYNSIKVYIKNQLIWDCNRIVKGYIFFDQLKPSLRFALTQDLFSSFRTEFMHIFKYENADAGNEFISYFVCNLNCHIFLANQKIIEKG